MRVFFRRWIIIACWFDETDFWGSQSIKFVMVTNFELRSSLKTAEFSREKNRKFYFWIHYFVLNYSNGCVKVTDSFWRFNQSKLIHNRFHFSRFFVRKNAWNLLNFYATQHSITSRLSCAESFSGHVVDLQWMERIQILCPLDTSLVCTCAAYGLSYMTKLSIDGSFMFNCLSRSVFVISFNLQVAEVVSYIGTSRC